MAMQMWVHQMATLQVRMCEMSSLKIGQKLTELGATSSIAMNFK